MPTTVKEISIKNAGGTYDTNPVGAEAQYVEVSRDSSGDIIEDITATGVTVSSTEGLAETLKNLEKSVADSNEFSEMTDVDFTSLADKNLVQYDNTTGKWKNIAMDTTPTASSNKPVTSGGIKTALDAKANDADLKTVAKTGNASDVNYTNTTSGLTATKVQAAIDEVDSNYDSLKETLTNEVITRSVVSSHNWLNLDGSVFVPINGTVATRTDNGVRVSKSEAGTYLGVSYTFYNLNKNTDYKLSTDITVTAGKGCIRMKADDSTWLFESAGLSTGKYEKTFNTGNYTEFKLYLYCAYTTSAAGNVLFDNLMITLDTDSDTTYRPYVPTNSQLLSYKDNGVLGAKNFLPYPFNSEANTTGGLTYTDNGDGSVSVSDGTATGVSFFRFCTKDLKFLKAGSYIFSFDIVGTIASSDATMQVITRSTPAGSIVQLVSDTLQGKSHVELNVTLTTDLYVVFQFYLLTGTFTNVKITPMIRLSTDSDPTYQPYAMTNKELTKSTLYFTSVACAATRGNFATISDSAITTDHVVVDCTFANPSAITQDVTWTTSNSSLVLNGTCESATTANITLSRKGN